MTLPAFDLSLLGPDINGMIAELATPAGWWAVGVLAACVLLAMQLSASLQKSLADRPDLVGRFRAAWMRRIGWPVLALVLLVVARALLQRVLPVSILDIATQLLLAAVIIRTILLVLQQTFDSDAKWLASFEQTIATTVWVIAALHVLDLLPMVVDKLDDAAIPLGKSRLSLLQLITGVVTVALASLIALWISRALDARLAVATELPQGARAVIGRIAKPMLLALALLIALPLVGIDLTMLSVFGGALGVGLGFGMQKIAANYISGFIILLDQSIEPGKSIRVDKYRGTVTDIRTRYTVLKSLDGIDAIVPNEMLVGSVVESETFNDSPTRFSLKVGVGYGDDVEAAMRILVEVASSHPRTLQHPPPRALLIEFGDSAIMLELYFWVADPQIGVMPMRSEMSLQILRRFKAEGIDIPYPHRQVVIKDLPAGMIKPSSP
jgi:small-conductance mechanosensitive channel